MVQGISMDLIMPSAMAVESFWFLKFNHLKWYLLSVIQTVNFLNNISRHLPVFYLFIIVDDCPVCY